MRVKKVRDAADAKMLLSSGENPYEIQRQFLCSKLQQRHKFQIQHVIAAGRERILKQLLCEEHAWSNELNAAARKQVCAELPGPQSLLPGCPVVGRFASFCLTGCQLDEAGL